MLSAAARSAARVSIFTGGLIARSILLVSTVIGGVDGMKSVCEVCATNEVIYAVSGLLSFEAWHMFVLIVPAMLIPTLIGARLYRRFSELAFRRLVLLLLSLSGFVLLGVSVPQLLS